MSQRSHAVETWKLPREVGNHQVSKLCSAQQHVLFGTQAEWPGILSCSETSEHSFPLSSLISSLCLLHHLNFRHCIVYSTVDHKNDICKSHTINDAQCGAQQAQQAQL